MKMINAAATIDPVDTKILASNDTIPIKLGKDRVRG
jgi:hypothetical protein